MTQFCDKDKHDTVSKCVFRNLQVDRESGTLEEGAEKTFNERSVRLYTRRGPHSYSRAGLLVSPLVQSVHKELGAERPSLVQKV